MKDLDRLIATIAPWHRMAFPWAKLPHTMAKLDEERREAVMAWGVAMDDEAAADELADCLICVLAAMARLETQPESWQSVVERKFSRVRQKYGCEQPAPVLQSTGRRGVPPPQLTLHTSVKEHADGCDEI